MTTSTVSLDSVIQLLEEYCPDGYELGTYKEIIIYYNKISNSLHPTSRSNLDSSKSDSLKGISSNAQFEDVFISKGIRYDIKHEESKRIYSNDNSNDNGNNDNDVETYMHLDILVRLKK